MLFFHPAVWLVSRRVSAERENACDDLVVTGYVPDVTPYLTGCRVSMTCTAGISVQVSLT